MVHREAPGDEAATGTAHDYGCFEMERVHERRQIRREIAGMKASRWTARITMAPLRQGVSVDRHGQIRQHELEGSPGVRDGVQEHYGNSRGVSLLDIRERHPAGKPNRPDNELAPLLGHATTSSVSLLRWVRFCLLALLVDEDATEELAHRALGQFLTELDRLRSLVGCETLLTEVEDLFLCRLGAGAFDDEGLDRLAAVLVGDADRDGLGHVGVLEEDLFDLARVDVVAGGHDHVLLPVDDVEVAALVHLRDVARVEPAVPQRLCRLIGHAPVALHDLRAPDDQLPRLADGHLVLPRLSVYYSGVGRRDGNADAALAPFPQKGRIVVRYGGGFRETVALEKGFSDLLFERTLQVYGEGGPTRVEDHYVVEVMLAQVRVASQERHVHCGDAGEHSRPVVLEDSQSLLYFEAGEQYLLDAEPYAEEHHAGQAVDVEEGQGAYAFAAPELGRVADEHIDSLLYVSNQVTVGQHRTLGHPRRSARVLQSRHVLGRIYVHLGGGIGVTGEEIPEGAVSGVESLGLAMEVHDDSTLQVCIGQHGFYAPVPVCVDDDGFGAGVVEDVGDLSLDVEGVDLGDERPEPHRREEGDHILRAVG